MGLARWRDGELTNYRDPAGSIMAILEDHAGTIWIARANNTDSKVLFVKSQIQDSDVMEETMELQLLMRWHWPTIRCRC